RRAPFPGAAGGAFPERVARGLLRRVRRELLPARPAEQQPLWRGPLPARHVPADRSRPSEPELVSGSHGQLRPRHVGSASERLHRHQCMVPPHRRGTNDHSGVQVTNPIGWAASRDLYYSVLAAAPPIFTFREFALAMMGQASLMPGADDRMAGPVHAVGCAWYAVGVFSRDDVEGWDVHCDASDAGT